MSFDIIKLFREGMTGRVVYDDNEDSFKLTNGILGFDLCQALWDDYEGKKVRVIIEILEDDYIEMI